MWGRQPPGNWSDGLWVPQRKKNKWVVGVEPTNINSSPKIPRQVTSLWRPNSITLKPLFGSYTHYSNFDELLNLSKYHMIYVVDKY